MTDLEKKVRKALKGVVDPELHINIVDLGLIYDVREEDGAAVAKGYGEPKAVKIEMTLTSPGCPLASVIDSEINRVVKKIKGVKKMTMELIWDPPWTAEMMSEEAKAELGFD